MDDLHRQDHHAGAGAARAAGRLARIADTRTLAEAQAMAPRGESVLAALIAAALQEIRLSAGYGRDDGIKERAASRFVEIGRAEARAMRQGMAVLATIGATAPFVGLFGTVWGIMNSFIGISKAQTTNLAVVAPGIAEALLATAIGLGAAIPAVIIYNYFSRAIKNYLEQVGARVRRRRPAVVARSRSRCATACRRRRRSRAMAAAIGDFDDDDDDFDEVHDINVTPFIDVMLVLLIIFMIAAPLSTVDLPVDLPTSTAVPQQRPDKPTYVTIKADLAVAHRRDCGQARRPGARARRHARRRQGPPHLPARRPRGALRRTDGRAGTAAPRRL